MSEDRFRQRQGAGRQKDMRSDDDILKEVPRWAKSRHWRHLRPLTPTRHRRQRTLAQQGRHQTLIESLERKEVMDSDDAPPSPVLTGPPFLTFARVSRMDNLGHLMCSPELQETSAWPGQGPNRYENTSNRSETVVEARVGPNIV